MKKKSNDNIYPISLRGVAKFFTLFFTALIVLMIFFPPDMPSKIVKGLQILLCIKIILIWYIVYRINRIKKPTDFHCRVKDTMNHPKVYTYEKRDMISQKILFFIVLLLLPITWYYGYGEPKITFSLSIYTILIPFFIFFYFCQLKLYNMKIEIDDTQIRFVTHKYEIVSNWDEIIEITIEKNISKHELFIKSENRIKWGKYEIYNITVNTVNGNFFFVHSLTDNRYNLGDIIGQLKAKATKAKFIFKDKVGGLTPLTVLMENKV